MGRTLRNIGLMRLFWLKRPDSGPAIAKVALVIRPIGLCCFTEIVGLAHQYH